MNELVVHANRVKAKMRQGPLALGTSVGVADLAVVEVIGLAGLDGAHRHGADLLRLQPGGRDDPHLRGRQGDPQRPRTRSIEALLSENPRSA